MSGACDNFILEDQSCEWFDLIQYVESFDMGINFLEGPPGPPGPAGEAIFIPSVSEDGVLSWTNTAGLPNPDPIDLSGPAGTTDYTDMTNKPSINGVELKGNKTSADLGISTVTPFVNTGAKIGSDIIGPGQSATPSQNCFCVVQMGATSGTAATVSINGVLVASTLIQTTESSTYPVMATFYVRSGQTVSTRNVAGQAYVMRFYALYTA